MIKGILFDYGGTIDTDGIHWANVIWDSYVSNGVTIDKELFGQAYVYGERALALKPLVKPSHTFLDVLTLKTAQQFLFLAENGVPLEEALIGKIARTCNDFAYAKVQAATPILATLSAKFPLVMVSNFYGNLTTVLETFGILHFFQSVVESAVVGVRKPDAAIYQLGVDAIGLQAHECLVVGDSYSKDIVPATTVGCQTAWINGIGWNDAPMTNTSVATYEIKSLEELRAILSLN